MAGLSNLGMDSDGLRQQAGLDIYRGGRLIDRARKINKVAATTPQTHSGAAMYHHGQAMNPSSLAATSASAAKQVTRSQFNGLSPL